MQTELRRASMASALALLLGSCTATPHPETDEWHALFDVDGTSWSYVGDATWSFSDGELIAANATMNSFIVTNRTYSDFRLQADFYPVDETNSGIYFRCDPDRLTAMDCYEANIADNHQNEQSRTGSLVGDIPSRTFDPRRSIGGTAMKLWLWAPEFRSGPTAFKRQNLHRRPFRRASLQLFKTGEVRFRNIRIQEM